MQLFGFSCSLAAAAAFGVASLTANAEIREQAVVSVTMDEAGTGILPAGAELADSATAGKQADRGSLPNGATLVSSAFSPSTSGKSLLTDPAKKQVLQFSSSDDLSFANAVTVSGFFASLHPLNDSTFHGLFAKRQPAGANKTNYGINFQPAADSFQVYVNDGSGYKVAVFSVKSAIGSRRRSHISAVFQTADAPGADSDAEADDTRIQLFINGIAIAPGSVNAGFVDGTTAWLTDVRLENCTSDTPFVVGGSFADGELTRMICDDLHLFDFALSEEQARKLFDEVAGSSAAEIAKEQQEASAMQPTEPVITSLSQYALTIGQSNRLAVRGRNLAGARIQLPLNGMVVAAVEGGSPQKAEFQVTPPVGTIPGRYLLRIVAEGGISRPVLLSIDGLPQHTDGQFTQASPATSLPIAVSGLISGTEQKRVYFSGTAGQRIVAEVEARRLGSRLDPVVEIKSAQGTPLAVQWQTAELSGDARAEVKLPEDGIYFAEVHDLQFRAPGNSPWRLLLGDLPASSLSYPPAVSSGTATLRTLGESGVSEPLTVRAERADARVESGAALLPLPGLIESTGREVTESLEGGFGDAPLDATFTTAPFPPLFVNGRITAPGEVDTFLLTVTPGQVLHCAVGSRELSSPLRAELSLFHGDNRIAFSDGASGVEDPFVDVTVPEGVTQLRFQIRDFTDRGSPASVYRLQIGRKDRPGFRLQTDDDSLLLPKNGSVPLRLTVVRQTPGFRYTGPIRLQAGGLPGVTVTPELIPAADQDQRVLLVVTRTLPPRQAQAMTGMAAEAVLQLEGRTEGLDANVTSSLHLRPDLLPPGLPTFDRSGIPADQEQAVPAFVTLDSVPPVLLRGIPAAISLKVLPAVDRLDPFVRFDMLTTEAPRRTDPRDPKSALKPAVSLPEFLFGSTAEQSFQLPINVPVDVAEKTIDAVIGADFVPQPLSSPKGSKAWTAPIRFAIDDAATLTISPDAYKGGKAGDISITGTLKRHPQFTEAVKVVLEGAPEGYTVTPAEVAADQTAFSVLVRTPDNAAPAEVPNLTLRVQRTDGSPVSPAAAVKLTIE